MMITPKIYFFNIYSLCILPRSNIVDRTFFVIMRFPPKNAKLIFIFEKPFEKKKFGVPTYFLFYFKKENKIRKKNP